jgi:hypothetical protein
MGKLPRSRPAGEEGAFAFIIFGFAIVVALLPLPPSPPIRSVAFCGRPMTTSTAANAMAARWRMLGRRRPARVSFSSPIVVGERAMQAVAFLEPTMHARRARGMVRRTPVDFGRRRRHDTTWAAWASADAAEDSPFPDSGPEGESPSSSSLESKLRRLALLNGGVTVNPRSPRQVSNLLYPGDDECGPTDRATLQRILDRDDDDDDDDDVAAGETDRRRREVATLVLQCRELLASNNVGVVGPKQFSPSSASSPIDVRSIARPTMQVIANYSNAALDNGQDDCDVTSVMENDGEKGTSTLIRGLVDEDDVDAPISPESAASTPFPTAAAGYISMTMSPYERMVMNLFPVNDGDVDDVDEDAIHENSNDDDDADADALPPENDAGLDASAIHPYWIEPLLSLTKSSSRSLVRQLSTRASCPMGYDPHASPLSQQRRGAAVALATTTTSSTPLLSYVRSQKSAYFPDVVVLLRVGDFYESYGVDAVMLVEHCGLNPMAGRARAGCPWRNVQDTLDKLTNAGFRVAVYEEDEKERREGNGWRRDDEDADADADGGGTGSGKSSKLKTRYLAQVVSSANPTYMHGLVLKDDCGASADDNAPSSSHGDLSSPGRNHVGVIETNAGYTLVEICGEERTAMISERLTSEAVCCRLAAFPPADPIFYVPPSTTARSQRRSDRLPFLPWTQRQHSSQRFSHAGGVGGGTMVGKVRVKTLPPSLVVGPRPGLTDVERAKQTIVSAFLRLEEYDHRNPELQTESSLSSSSPPMRKRGIKATVVTPDDFTVIVAPSSSLKEAITRPLHLETATQLGLMSDPAIPSLISSLLPDSAPSSTRRYLRRWLLIPPPPDISDAMSNLVRTLKDDGNRALPPLMLGAPPLSGKVISLIRAGQASATVYREILVALDAASDVLLLDRGGGDKSSGIVNALMTILRHDTGTEESDPVALRKKFLVAMEMIESVINTQNMEYSLQNIDQNNENDSREMDCVSYYGDVVPHAFFDRNEAIWRGRIKPNAMEPSVQRVPTAAKRLAEAVALDFWGVGDDNISYDDDCTIINLSEAKESKSPIIQDIFNNLILIKSIPSWAEQKGTKYDEVSDYYFNPRDRNGKVLRTRFTTSLVQEALSDYVEACSNARAEVERVLTRLSWDLVDGGHLSAILQSSHLNLILATAAHHAASSNAKGWSVATVHDDDNDDDDGEKESSAGYFRCVWPYWMDRSESVSNSFDLDGLFLLTAPNMSGKSTLMRSTAAAALMINAGLCAPVNPGSSVRRFDSIFLRGASADVPTEDKSAFGAEMGDVASLLRTCGRKSLVFVDEIGRGTSPKDGTSLAGAILEQMSGVSRMNGMFATHLHGILKLPYSSAAEARIRKKRMAITEDSQGELKWTYTLEDGVCTNR